jgi:hypothetical protein
VKLSSEGLTVSVFVAVVRIVVGIVVVTVAMSVLRGTQSCRILKATFVGGSTADVKTARLSTPDSVVDGG